MPVGGWVLRVVERPREVEKDLVLVVAANTRGVGGDSEVEDFEAAGTAGEYVAEEDEVVG